MKRDVFLNYCSVVTGLGDLDQTWNGLLENRSAVRVREHFRNRILPVTGVSLFNREFDDPQDNITQRLAENCLRGMPALPSDTFVIWSGAKNNVEDIESRYNSTEKPMLSSSHEFRVWLSDRLGFKAGGMEMYAACASSSAGAGLAYQFISEGRYDHVLILGVDIVSRFVYLGFAALKAMNEKPCMPFDKNRDGLTLGDGAVLLYLSSQRNSDIRITGYGVTNDANHITGPSRDGSGLAKALNSAIMMSGTPADEVQAFCAHGTGTPYNDNMELLAARTVFGGRSVPIFGVKGAIGHTMGAAGGIEIAVCAKCLETGLLPPTVACRTPESPDIVMEKRPFGGRNILTSNSGFGGINAAVMMEKVS